MCCAISSDYDIEWDVKTHIHEIDETHLHTENDKGEIREIEYDFAMLIPPFEGQSIQYLDRMSETSRRSC